jgi:hypothetical protein
MIVVSVLVCFNPVVLMLKCKDKSDQRTASVFQLVAVALSH